MSNEELKLGDIPGLGPVRQAALAEAGIHDLQGLLRLKVAELAAIRGVGHWQARKITEFLRQRGLVLEVEVPGGEPTVVMVAPETPEEQAAVAEAMETLATQAAIEANLEAEVAQLEEAVTATRDGVNGASLADEEAAVVEASTAVAEEEPARKPAEEQTVVEQIDETPEPTSPPGDASGEVQAEALETTSVEASEEDAGDWEGRIREQREQLPEAALELMEAIRAAAVNKQLTRQITRLLILAGEFINDSRPLSAKQRQAASEALAQAEEALRRAIEKESFSPRDQKELAERIRRRRKQLEQVLERE